MAHLQILFPDGSTQTYEIKDEQITVGRTEDNTIKISDESVSSHHAEIIFDGQHYLLRDLGSTNGTFAGESQISEVLLSDGMEIRFGAVAAIFSNVEASPPINFQPLPESSQPITEVAQISARPENFISSSPIPRNFQRKDPMETVSYVISGLGLVACLAGAIFSLTMQL